MSTGKVKVTYTYLPILYQYPILATYVCSEARYGVGSRMWGPNPPIVYLRIQHAGCLVPNLQRHYWSNNQVGTWVIQLSLDRYLPFPPSLCR
jgi:hypothetical protein